MGNPRKTEYEIYGYKCVSVRDENSVQRREGFIHYLLYQDCNGTRLYKIGTFGVATFSKESISTSKVHRRGFYDCYLAIGIAIHYGFESVLDIVLPKDRTIDDVLKFIAKCKECEHNGFIEPIEKWFHSMPKEDQFTYMMSGFNIGEV